MTAPVSVPAANFVKAPGYWMSEALRRPVHIVHHDRARLVLTSPAQLSYEGRDGHETETQTLSRRTPPP